MNALLQIEVLESQRIGHLTDALIELVSKMCRLRCHLELIDDITQTALMQLMSHLNSIDPTEHVEGYIGQTINRCFMQIMRTRSTERRYLLWRVEQDLSNMPSHMRGWLRGKAYASEQRLRKLKYY